MQTSLAGENFLLRHRFLGLFSLELDSFPQRTFTRVPRLRPKSHSDATGCGWGKRDVYYQYHTYTVLLVLVQYVHTLMCTVVYSLARKRGAFELQSRNVIPPSPLPVIHYPSPTLALIAATNPFLPLCTAPTTSRQVCGLGCCYRRRSREKSGEAVSIWGGLLTSTFFRSGIFLAIGPLSRPPLAWTMCVPLHHRNCAF